MPKQHVKAALVHLGEIAYAQGRLDFDLSVEQFIGNDEANVAQNIVNHSV